MNDTEKSPLIIRDGAKVTYKGFTCIYGHVYTRNGRTYAILSMENGNLGFNVPKDEWSLIKIVTA